MEPTDGEKRAAGRPRQDIDNRVLDAALELLDVHGFQELSISKISAQSGISRPTIYRRWADKVEIVVAAVERIHADEPLPQYESIASDLERELIEMTRAYGRIGIPVIAGAIAESPRHPEILASLREQVIIPRRTRIQAIVQAAIAAGDLRSDTDPKVVAALMGGVFYGMFTQSIVLTEEAARTAVEIIVSGITKS